MGSIAHRPTISFVPLVAAAASGALIAAPAQAEVIDAPSCATADVQAAIDAAADGDVVSVPAGTCTWTAGVTIGEVVDWGPPVVIESKAVTIQGAGQGRTTIVNEIPGDTPSTDDSLLDILSLEGKPFRVSGLTLQGGPEGTGDSDHGAIRIGGSCKSWRVDHVTFLQLRSRGIRINGDTHGVVDHCEFTTGQWAQPIYVDHSGWGGESWGDGSWSSPLNLGSGEAVFMEDNVFTWDGGDTPIGALDCGGGGRFVFRHNQIHNTSIGNHGTESTGRFRSCFSYEIYENHFDRPVTPSRWTLFFNRGGTGVMWGNRATGNYDSLSHVANFRDYHPFDAWAACDGTSPYDQNDGTTYEQGTHTGADGADVLTSAGAGWTADQWVGYSVHNTTQGRSGIIVANGADTIEVTPDQYDTPLSWNTGDAFEILQAYPCLDQVGRSTGDVLSGDPPTPQAWPNQALEPFYEWDNTINDGAADIVADSPHLVENRDYYNDTERSGYTPYTYPHPLTLTTCAELGGSCCSAAESCDGTAQHASDCEGVCCVSGSCVPGGTGGSGTGGAPPGAAPSDDEGGCGCRLGGARSSPPWHHALSALFAWALATARRRCSRP